MLEAGYPRCMQAIDCIDTRRDNPDAIAGESGQPQDTTLSRNKAKVGGSPAVVNRECLSTIGGCPPQCYNHWVLPRFSVIGLAPLVQYQREGH